MKNTLLFFLLICGPFLLAQDLDELLDAETLPSDTPASEVVTDIFPDTRVINLPSTEQVPAGMLDFWISHRFGLLNSGISELFGIDAAQVRFNFEYGLSDGWSVGLARNTFRKTYEGYTKIRLTQQRVGAKGFPFSAALYANVGVWSVSNIDFFDGRNPENYQFSERLSYTTQLVLSRKFGNRFSLLLAPTWVSLSETNAYALGTAIRWQLTPRLAFTGEYVPLFNREELPAVDQEPVRNSFSIGFDINTGGHNFQLHLTNSSPQNASGYIAQTTSDWGAGDIRFGFNIKRSFVIIKNPNIKRL
ncbi:MAG: DUF5777 family beta-barrel protein [Bernardetiaceae bacterium]